MPNLYSTKGRIQDLQRSSGKVRQSAVPSAELCHTSEPSNAPMSEDVICVGKRGGIIRLQCTLRVSGRISVAGVHNGAM